MDLAEPTLILLTTILLIAALILSFIPIMPGPVMIWAIVVIFGALEGFSRLTPVAALGATVVMLVASTSDFWLPLFGIRTGGLSCLSTIGALVGGLVGTFLIPVPVIGTLVGCIVGALVVELVRMKELRAALRAGRTAFNMYVLSYVVQLVAGFLIFAVYVVSLLSTSPT